MSRFYTANEGDERVLECVPGIGATIHKVCGSPEAARREAWRLNLETTDIGGSRRDRLAVLRRL